MLLTVALRDAIADGVRQRRCARFNIWMFISEAVALFIISILLWVLIFFENIILVLVHVRTMVA